MNKTLLIGLGLAALVGGIYLYTKSSGGEEKSVGAKGAKKKPIIAGSKIPIGGNSGLSINIPASDPFQFLSGIWHPTNGNAPTETAPSQTSQRTVGPVTTTSDATST